LLNAKRSSDVVCRTQTGHRAERLERIIAEALEYQLLPELEDPRLQGLRVLRVEVVGNLSGVVAVLVPRRRTPGLFKTSKRALNRPSGTSARNGQHAVHQTHADAAAEVPAVLPEPGGERRRRMRIVNDPHQTVPLWVWAVKVDAESLKRLTVLARWGRLAGPIAVMPDVHPAGDICVGTVFATADALVPGALGDDLGCGMAVARLPLHVQELTLEDLRAIVAQALEAVPSVGGRTMGRSRCLSGCASRSARTL